MFNFELENLKDSYSLLKNSYLKKEKNKITIQILILKTFTKKKLI